MRGVAVSGAFDNLRSTHLRYLHEASRIGPVTVVLWDDETAGRLTGRCQFPVAERKYLLDAVRFVDRVVVAPPGTEPDALPDDVVAAVDAWVMPEGEDSRPRRQFCTRNWLELRTVSPAQLAGFPTPAFDPDRLENGRRRVIVTGCYDWFHSGHVRFFEECSQLGDLYVAAGNDANVRLLKGEGHPLFPQDERQYVVSCCRYVTQALVTTGMGWMDAEPEIARIRPHLYAVNEDGDKPEKRRFCEEHGLEYVVLRRTPANGLPRRSSSDLRGF